jgi:hypothetical protein
MRFSLGVSIDPFTLLHIALVGAVRTFCEPIPPYIPNRINRMPQINLTRYALCSVFTLFALSISGQVDARDSRCPQGMNSPDGNVCVPGEGMSDEIRSIQNRRPSFLPSRDPAIDRVRFARQEAFNRLIRKLRLYNDPDYVRYMTGKWRLLSPPEGEKKGEYCSAFYSRGGTILTLAGPGGDFKGASLIFTSKDIPRPNKQEIVKVTLIQNKEPPVTVKAFNYSPPRHSFGSIAVAVPTIDALLNSIEDEQHFDLQIDGKSISKILWLRGFAARAEFRKCLSGEPYTVTQIDGIPDLDNKLRQAREEIDTLENRFGQ